MRTLAPLLLSATLLGLCSEAAHAADDPASQFKHGLDGIVAEGGVAGLVATVRARPSALDLDCASGHLARPPSERAQTPLAPTDEFRIASVTKTFTAAAILRLVEQGRFTLETPISRLIAPQTAELLLDGGYRPEGISVRQLLNHTSGLYDFATDPHFLTAVGSEPGKLWTRREQVALAMRVGKPIAAPGVRAAYSDTGYVILGEILERATGLSYGEAMAKLIGFDRLGLRDTYLEPAPAGVVANLPERRIAQDESGLDATRLNPSFDLFGGGGLVSTTRDLATFFEALLEGRVFKRPETLTAMITLPTGVVPDVDGDIYALGLKPQQRGAETCWGHFGHWGTIAGWCPASHSGYALSGNSASPAGYGAVSRALDLADQLRRTSGPR